MTAPMLRRVSSQRPPPDRQRRPTNAQWSITVAALCLATFIALRFVLLLANGPSAFDVWLEDHVRQEHASRALRILEHLVSLPGSRKGAMAVTVSVGAWVWFRRRDVRPGIVLVAAFTGTAATVALLKTLLVLVWPIEAPGGDAARAFVSSHTANAVAVFAMLAVVVALSGREDLLRLAVAAAVTMVAAVALAEMAAGRHYLVDLVSGAAVGGAWVFALVPLGQLLWARPDLGSLPKRLYQDDPARDYTLEGATSERDLSAREFSPPET
jgi:membrane-associated phospholipid phosphatase